MISWLPDDSAYQADRIGGIEYKGWTYERYLGMALVNLAMSSGYAFRMAHSDPKKHRPQAPKYLKGPKEAAADSAKKMSPEDVARNEANEAAFLAKARQAGAFDNVNEGGDSDG